MDRKKKNENGDLDLEFICFIWRTVIVLFCFMSMDVLYIRYSMYREIYIIGGCFKPKQERTTYFEIYAMLLDILYYTVQYGDFLVLLFFHHQ